MPATTPQQLLPIACPDCGQTLLEYDPSRGLYVLRHKGRRAVVGQVLVVQCGLSYFTPSGRRAPCTGTWSPEVALATR